MFFFSTREEIGLYHYIIKSIKLKIKKKYNIETILYNLPKKITLRFIYFFFFNLIVLNIFRPKKIIKIKYRNCLIGRHVLAHVYRDTSSYKNSFSFYKNLIKSFIMGGLIIDHAYKLSKKIKFAYIDHIGYLNGLYFKVFLIKKKIIFSNGYPRGIYFLDASMKINKNFEIKNIIKIEKQKKIKNKINYKKNSFIKKIIKDPKLVPWMKSTKFIKVKNKKFHNDLKEITHVIYTHSFLDGQLWFGYDGFLNMRDWLEFTIKRLDNSKNKVLVKAHPNFYNKEISQYSTIDKRIFDKLFKAYNSKNIIFLNKPVENKILLKNIKKNTILISHHGTSLLEGMYSGFKCISSFSTIWSDTFQLTNNWNTKFNYKKILNKDFNQLFYPNSSDLNEVSAKLFNNPISEYGKRSWYKIVMKKFKNKEKLYNKLMKQKAKNLILSKKNTRELVNSIEKDIEQIKLN